MRPASAVAHRLTTHADRRDGQCLPAEVHASGFQPNHPQLSTLPLPSMIRLSFDVMASGVRFIKRYGVTSIRIGR
ncbi:hypothetical protein CPI84_01985 [Erwinia pyrifoliae]|nr:hypothetical protein CPI84_01985 [Erwinia pyrifoliae]